MTSWKHLARELPKAAATPPPRPADDFWSEFKARARLHPQAAPETVTRPLPYARWSLAGAAALVLIAATLTSLLRSPSMTAEKGATIHSVRVDVAHKGVMIMEDQPSRATIVWVVDMDATSQGETGT